MKPRSILRLSSPPFLVLFTADKDVNFQADFGPTADQLSLSSTVVSNELDTATMQPPQRRPKRYVDIMANNNDDMQDNDIGAWDRMSTSLPPSPTSLPAITATTAKIRRRRKKPAPGVKKYKQSPPDRNWENEVLSFDDAGEDDDDKDDYDDDDDNDDVLNLDYEEDDLSESEADKFRWSTQDGAAVGGDLIPLPRGYGKHRSGSRGSNRNNSRSSSRRRKNRNRANRRTNKKTEAAEAAPKSSNNKPRSQQLPSLWKSFEHQVAYYLSSESSY